MLGLNFKNNEQAGTLRQWFEASKVVEPGDSSKAIGCRRSRDSQSRRRGLTLLASAESLGDLVVLPSSRLERLRGDRDGQCSIRINAQWRICFRWEADGPYDVEIVDYLR